MLIENRTAVTIYVEDVLSAEDVSPEKNFFLWHELKPGEFDVFNDQYPATRIYSDIGSCVVVLNILSNDFGHIENFGSLTAEVGPKKKAGIYIIVTQTK